MVERRILLVRNSFDQARAKPRVAFIEKLADRHRGADSRYAGDFDGMLNGNSEGLRAAQGDRAGRAQHDFSADVCFAFAALAQQTVGQPNREDYQQDTQGNAGNADRGARRPMREI